MSSSTPFYLAPTLTMLALLKKLHDTGGRMIERDRPPYGFNVRQVDGNGPLFWYPTRAGRGVANRGLVDDSGFINAAGRAELRKAKILSVGFSPEDTGKALITPEP